MRKFNLNWQKGYEEGLKVGIANENNRIIKLLEADEWHHISFATRGVDDEPIKYHDGECLGCRQIALINGEAE